MKIKLMSIEDYDSVYQLWINIEGMCIQGYYAWDVERNSTKFVVS
ncbi:hypothetical protein [Clostridium simiarum]|nr:hypothetical protein [Clostridium simiarum]